MSQQKDMDEGEKFSSYESAAKEIEQEKKMVAALKRLSIGNMMNFDPDLPQDEKDYQLYSSDDGSSVHSLGSTSLESRSHSNVSPSRRSGKSPSSSRSSSKSPSPAKALAIGRNDLKDTSDKDDFYDDDYTMIDTDTAFWVSANEHPEVNPEQFKINFESKIKELIDNRTNRNSGLKRQSSLLSSGSVQRDNGDDAQIRQEVPSDKVKSDVALPQHIEAGSNNPSLRTLVNQLEVLSKVAGIDSEDAISIAKSLSKSSVGFTDVEKQALDGYVSPASGSSTTRNVQISSDYSIKDSLIEKESHLTNERISDRSSPWVNNPSQESNNLGLRRNQRRVHRANSPHGAAIISGSNLQASKAGRLADLRSSLNTPAIPRVSSDALERKLHFKGTKSHSIMHARHMYSDPNLSGSSHSGSSPYPTTAVSHQPIESHFNSHKHNQHGLPSKKLYPERFSSSGSELSKSHNITKKNEGRHGFSKRSPSRPRQNPPLHPFIGTSHQPIVNSQHRRDVSRKLDRENGQDSKSYSFNRTHRRAPYKALPSFEKVPSEYMVRTKQAPMLKNELQKERSFDKENKNLNLNLNENLNQLREEISTFKDSLTRIESTSLSSDEEISAKDSIAQDTSFQSSLQNISYEDSLGIEKDALEELRSDQSKNTEFSDQNILDDISYDMENQNVEAPSKECNTEDLKDKQEDLKTSPFKYSNSEKHKEDDTIPNSRGTGVFLEDSHRDNKFSLLDQYPDVSNGRGIESDNWLEAKSPMGLEEKEVKKKKSWTWLRERSSSHSLDSSNPLIHSINKKDTPRSVSSPELASNNSDRDESHPSDRKLSFGSSKENLKDNVISKFFKKTRSNSNSSSDFSPKMQNSAGVTVDYESDNESKKSLQNKIKTGLFKRRNKDKSGNGNGNGNGNGKASLISVISKSEKRFSQKVRDSVGSGKLIFESQEKDQTKASEVYESTKSQTYDLKSQSDASLLTKESETIENDILPHQKFTSESTQILDERKSPNSVNTSNGTKVSGYKAASEALPSDITLDIQEKIRKSIRRTSKANQPIHFTDSAFGFPLPPPSQSTLAMLHHRFPVNVERAIYRLSHLKLANPKRSLREQVVLSNFMYAYLNLVDHTLHLEQRMSNGAKLEKLQNASESVFSEAEEVPLSDDNPSFIDMNSHEQIKVDI